MTKAKALFAGPRRRIAALLGLLALALSFVGYAATPVKASGTINFVNADLIEPCNGSNSCLRITVGGLDWDKVGKIAYAGKPKPGSGPNWNQATWSIVNCSASNNSKIVGGAVTCGAVGSDNHPQADWTIISDPAPPTSIEPTVNLWVQVNTCVEDVIVSIQEQYPGGTGFESDSIVIGDMQGASGCP